jgi:hypothetical protein
MIQSKTNNHLSFPFSLFTFPFCEAGISTTVENPLQISPFLTNKPNFRKVKLSVNNVLTKDYAKWTLGQRGKNKPNSNPNKPNLRKAKMILNYYSTKDYENIANLVFCENKPNTNPIKPNFIPLALFIVYNSAKVKIKKEFYV